MSATQSAPKISWVVFDLGGVIIRIHHSWQFAARAAGVTLENDLQYQKSPQFMDLVSRFQRGQLSHQLFCDSVSQLTQCALSPQEVERIHQAVIIGEYCGVLKILSHLQRVGIATACLSNTNERHWQLMQTIPAFAAIEHRYASHLLHLEKPNRAIFEAFESATGAHANNILYFDDLAENISAAKQVGWNAVEIDALGEPAEQIQIALARYGVLP